MNSQQKIKPILESIYLIVKETVECDYQLFLFGSRAMGTNDNKADIDVGIIPENYLSPIQIQKIKEKIEELPTLLKIDFIDFTTVSEDFKSVALMHTKDLVL